MKSTQRKGWAVLVLVIGGVILICLACLLVLTLLPTETDAPPFDSTPAPGVVAEGAVPQPVVPLDLETVSRATQLGTWRPPKPVRTLRWVHGGFDDGGALLALQLESRKGLWLYDGQLGLVAQIAPDLGQGYVKRFDLSADGRWLLFSMGSTAYLWDRAADAVIADLRTSEESALSALALAPEPDVVATAQSYFVRLWSLADPDLPEPQVLEGCRGAYSLAFSPDGRYLAAGGDYETGTLALWRVEDGTLRYAIEAHDATEDGVRGLAFSPDGMLVATGGGDALVKLWAVEDGQLRVTLRGHSDSIERVAFSPDGSLLASGGRDGEVQLWTVSEGTLVQTLDPGDGFFRDLAFSPDGALLVIAGDARALHYWGVGE